MKLQRIQHIEAYIRQHGSVSLDELCEQFNVSKNTIRRDIRELEDQGIVRKVYGGVIFNDERTLIPSTAQREVTMHAAKTRIAQKAAEFVHDNDIIVVDSGTTTVHTLEYLRHKKNLTVITNSVPALNMASAYEQFHVIVTGGDFYRPTDSFVGLEAIAMLKRLNANILLLAATGVSLTKGITNYSTIESEIKKAMMEVSERIILLLDHTKFDLISLVTFAELKDIDILITNKALPSEYVRYCVKHNVEIIVTAQ